MFSNLLAQIREIILYVYNYIYTLALGIFNFYKKFSEKSQKNICKIKMVLMLGLTNV